MPTCAATSSARQRARALPRPRRRRDDEIKRGLNAGTFQHECDHLDGRLFLDRVVDTTTSTTWEQFERLHRDDFVARITAFVERVGP